MPNNKNNIILVGVLYYPMNIRRLQQSMCMQLHVLASYSNPRSSSPKNVVSGAVQTTTAHMLATKHLYIDYLCMNIVPG